MQRQSFLASNVYAGQHPKPQHWVPTTRNPTLVHQTRTTIIPGHRLKTERSLYVITTQGQDNTLAEAYAIRLCSHTFSVGLISEPREGWIVTSSMLTPRQTNRPKTPPTSMWMEVSYKCHLLGLCHFLALASFAHM